MTNSKDADPDQTVALYNNEEDSAIAVFFLDGPTAGVDTEQILQLRKKPAGA